MYRIIALLALAGSSTAIASPVCHVKGNGDEIQIDVNDSALSAHYDHGDAAPVTLYEDSDGDGLGNPDSSIQSCDESVDGHVDNANDSDDQNANTCTVDLGYTPDAVFANQGYEADPDYAEWGLLGSFDGSYYAVIFNRVEGDLWEYTFGPGLGAGGGALWFITGQLSLNSTDGACDGKTIVVDYGENTSTPSTITFAFTEDNESFDLIWADESTQAVFNGLGELQTCAVGAYYLDLGYSNVFGIDYSDCP